MFSTALPSAPRRALAGSFAMASLLLAAGCSSRGAAVEAAASAAQDPHNPYIEVAPAAPAGRSWSNALPARLVFRPRGMAAVAAVVDARVVAVDTRLGANVKAGDALVTLESGDAAKARAELTAAQAQAAAAEDALRRQTELVARGVGLEVERFAAETDVKQAQAELARARGAAALVGPGEGGTLVLRAPAAGVVMALNAKVGAVVAASGGPVAEIGDPGTVWVQADVPETVVRSVHVGAAARVRVDAIDADFDAVIDGFGGHIDDDQRRVAVYLRPATAAPGALPGMLAAVRLDNGEDQNLSVPVEAVLIKNGTDRIVYVRDDAGRYHARPVRTGLEREGRVAIVDGLRAGENVVVHGALLLDDDAEQLL